MTDRVESLMPIAHAATRGLYVAGYDREDLDQELRIAILAALNICDGRDPQPIVHVVARRRILTLMTRELRGPRRALNDAVSDDALVYRPDRSSTEREVETRDLLRRLAAVRLSEVERRSVMGLAAGFSVPELGLEARVADNAAQRARRKLREAA